MIFVEQSQHCFDDPSVPETIIALPLSTSENCQWSWNMGQGWTEDVATPGRMLLLPPDQPSQWSVTGDRTLLLLAIPSKTIREVLHAFSLDDVNSTLSALSHKCWEDDFLKHCIQRLWKSINSKSRLDKQLCDGALSNIIVQLAITSGSDKFEEKIIHLPAWRMNKLLDFVSRNIAMDIDVSAMAAATGLSNRHFSRAFAEQMRITPHRWLMEQRCEKAKFLLRSSEADLSAVARDCGFSDQSHFCKVFKEMTGETPRHWHSRNFN